MMFGIVKKIRNLLTVCGLADMINSVVEAIIVVAMR